MAILNFVTSSLGQTGQIPTFVFFDTNDPVAKVTSVGYLNHFVQQGNALSETSVALLTSQESSSVQPATNLYNIVFASGNYNLVKIGSGSGSGFNPATSYDGISNPAITGSYLYQGGWNVNAGSGNAVLESVTGSVSLLAPNSGQFVNITASNVSIQGTTATTIVGASFTGTFSGNASLNASGPLQLSGSSVLVPGLANSAQSNVVQYNTSTGAFSYAPATGFNPAISETITGAWAFNGGFSVTSASGNIPLVASAGNISLTASSGNITLNSPSVNLPALTNVVTANVLYYNSSSGLVSFGAPGAINTALNYTWTGSNNFNGPFAVAAPSGDVTLDSLAGSVNLLAPTTGKAINLQSPTVAVNASSAFSVSAGSSSYQTTGSGALSVVAGGILSLQGAGGINLPTLASAAATVNVVYYNSSTGYISYAAAPSGGGMTWNNSTTSPVSMAVANGYVTNDSSAQISYILPTSSSVGQIVDVVGNSSAGWVINQSAGQNIQIGSVSSTIGTGGSVTSGNRYDCVSLICTVANTTWVSKSIVGNVTIV